MDFYSEQPFLSADWLTYECEITWYATKCAESCSATIVLYS